MRRQDRHQAGVLKHARMQVVREVPDVLRQGNRPLLERRHLALNVAEAASFPVLQAAEADREACQLLADVVVQVSRDAPPLAFLRGDQAAGQMLDFLMAVPQARLVLEQGLFGVFAFPDLLQASRTLEEQRDDEHGLDRQQQDAGEKLRLGTAPRH